jgi:H+/Cl- antiporter ClcA
VAKPFREVPPPLEGNDRQIAAIGTAVWAVALIVVFALRDQLSHGSHWWIWTCVVGVGLGLFGVVYVPYLHRSRARASERRSDSSAGGVSSPGH